MEEPGHVGHLVHTLSGKLLHPENDSSNPDRGIKLVIREGGLGQNHLKFQFVPATGKGHFGYIRHLSSGRYLHPETGGTQDPENGTVIVFWDGTHIQTLFAFDDINDRIMHRRGKYLHSQAGTIMPKDGTRIVTWDGYHEGARFILSDEMGRKISPYPDPELRGDWTLIKAVDDPKVEHTFKITYKTGRSITNTSTEQHSWNVSAEVAVKWFSARAEYAGFVERSTAETWTEEVEKSHTIKVVPGKTVVVWQYVFGAQQYGDQIDFQSNIFGDTHSVDEKPVLD